MKMLNFGCGDKIIPEAVNYDRITFNGNTVGELAPGKPLPFEDETFDAIIAHHSLQMIAYHDFIPALQELRRVLKTDGRIRISVPDLLWAISTLKAPEYGTPPIVDEAEKSIDGKVCAYITWYSEAKMVFTSEWLVELLERAGFRHVQTIEYGIGFYSDWDLREEESIFVIASK